MEKHGRRGDGRNDGVLAKTRGRHRLHNIGVSRVNRMSGQRASPFLSAGKGRRQPSSATTQTANLFRTSTDRFLRVLRVGESITTTRRRREIAIIDGDPFHFPRKLATNRCLDAFSIFPVFRFYGQRIYRCSPVADG